MKGPSGSTAARLLFLAVVVGFAWWGLRQSGDEVATAMGETEPLGVAVGLVAVLAGLALTGLLWRQVLAGYGHHLPVRAAGSVFFVGQLGKYVPGSVWSMGVQARLARQHDVPARTTVGTSLVFLLVHVATGLVVGALLAVDPGQPGWARLVGAAVGGVGLLLLAPAVAALVARRVGGQHAGFAWNARDVVLSSGFMLLVWSCYSVALVAVLPEAQVSALPALAAAFALGYVAGVAVPFAPAGVGAREAVFLFVAAPAVGIGPAASVAILARVLHTVGDFVAAGVAWAAARHAA